MQDVRMILCICTSVCGEGKFKLSENKVRTDISYYIYTRISNFVYTKESRKSLNQYGSRSQSLFTNPGNGGYD